MHEMSLAEGMIQLLEDHASSQQFKQVKKIWLEIGCLSNVEVESLLFCFDAVAKNTLAEHAEVIVERPMGQGFCLDCSQTIQCETLYQPCPLCQGHKIQVTGGQDMRIKELEVD